MSELAVGNAEVCAPGSDSTGDNAGGKCKWNTTGRERSIALCGRELGRPGLARGIALWREAATG